MKETVMPAKMEKSLKQEALKHGFKKGGKRYNAYVYGTLAKLKKLHKGK
jgi:hypothetical protein